MQSVSEVKMLIDCFRNIIKISSLHSAYRPFSHLRIKFDEFIIHINLPLPLQGEADRNVGVSRSENIAQYHNNATNMYYGATHRQGIWADL